MILIFRGILQSQNSAYHKGKFLIDFVCIDNSFIGTKNGEKNNPQHTKYLLIVRIEIL